MTKENYTHLTLVVDRSGSMHATRADAQGGIDTLLNEQFALDLPFTLTLVEFDGAIDTVVAMTPERPSYTLVPRGSTALYDAMGQAIVKTGADLFALEEDERPNNVIFVVVTDGGENASREYDFQSLQALIEQQKSIYNWTFQFIGADVSARQGTSLGINTTQYDNTGVGTRAVYTSASSSLTTSRLTGETFVMPETVTQ